MMADMLHVIKHSEMNAQHIIRNEPQNEQL